MGSGIGTGSLQSGSRFVFLFKGQHRFVWEDPQDKLLS
jgi:hypothetical protein